MGDNDPVFLMRISLTDVPGKLGSVASAMGEFGADILSVEIVEKRSGRAIDDFVVTLPPERMPDGLVSICQKIDGVAVDWVSRYPEGGGLQSDLEALERMTADPAYAAETLVSLSPEVFRSGWALLIDAGDHPAVIYSTPMAPDPDRGQLAGFGPFDTTHRLTLGDESIPGYSDSVVVVTPIETARAIIVGRQGGPAYLDSEVARLEHLAELAHSRRE